MCKFTATVDRIPCGYLFKNEQNAFVYSCSRCDEEFSVAIELEEHTMVHDVKNEIVIVDEKSVSLDARYNIRALSVPITRLSIDSLKMEPIITMDDTVDAHESDTLNRFKDACDPFEMDAECNADKIQSNDALSLLSIHSTPGPKSKTKPTTKEYKPKSKEKHICDICGKSFSSYGFIKRHILGGHKNDNDWIRIKPKRKKKEPVPCKICGKMLVAIKLHMRTFHSDDRPYKCGVCSMTYKYKSNLESHERLHTGDRPFMCSFCARRFKRNSEMHAHINTVHKKVRKHKCDRPDCDKSYVNLQQLKDHINVHHLNLRSYHCDICTRTMGTNKQYRQHMRDHLEKKFQCRYCESKFPTDLGRKLHEFGSHSTESNAVLI